MALAVVQVPVWAEISKPIEPCQHQSLFSMTEWATYLLWLFATGSFALLTSHLK